MTKTPVPITGRIPASSLPRIVSEEQAAREIQRAAGKGIRVLRVPCRKCHTKLRLLRTMARTLFFPKYFGMNWDAVYDCLCDVSWFPGKGNLIVFEEAHHLLRLRGQNPKILLDLFETATRKQGFRPFYGVLLVGSEHLKQRVKEIKKKKLKPPAASNVRWKWAPKEWLIALRELEEEEAQRKKQRRKS